MPRPVGHKRGCGCAVCVAIRNKRKAKSTALSARRKKESAVVRAECSVTLYQGDLERSCGKLQVHLDELSQLYAETVIPSPAGFVAHVFLASLVTYIVIWLLEVNYTLMTFAMAAVLNVLFAVLSIAVPYYSRRGRIEDLELEARALSEHIINCETKLVEAQLEKLRVTSNAAATSMERTV